MKSKTLRLTLAMLFCGTLASPLSAQNNIVTYQGHVQSGGAPFTGTGQFKFALVTSTNLSATATATAIMGGVAPNQFVSSCSIVSGGNSYTGPAGVTFSGGGGSGAVAVANVSGGVVTSVTVLNPGSGYSSAPTVTIDPPPPDFLYVTYWSNDGTSVDGSEPTDAVTVPVIDGLFTVRLGDDALPNMAALSATLFQQPDLELRLWFDDGVNGFAVLSPTQPLSAAPYALRAQSVAAGGVAGTYSNAVTLDNPANVFAGDGSALTGIHALDAADGAPTEVVFVDAEGKTGIGTTAPLDELHVAGDNATLRLEDTTTPGGYTLLEDAQPTQLRISKHNSAGLVLLDLNPKPADGTSAAVVRFFRETDTTGGKSVHFLQGNATAATSASIGVDGENSFFQLHGGNVGIGTANPQARLHVMGNILAGDAANSISSGVVGAVIAGGGGTNDPNIVTANYGAILGGTGNTASGLYSVAMGYHSTASATHSTALGFHSTASGHLSTAMGGSSTASGQFSTAMGYFSTASGLYSTAMGRRAQALHDGSFVWADSQNPDVTSARNNQFKVRADGGVYFDLNNSHWVDFRRQSSLTLSARILWTSTGAYLSEGGVWSNASDAAKKENFEPVDGREVLEAVSRLPIHKWNYRIEQDDIRHLGPTAQDFQAAFGLGGDDKAIATVDADGVALAAIQGLNSKLEQQLAQKATEIAEIRRQNAELENELAELKAVVNRLAQR